MIAAGLVYLAAFGLAWAGLQPWLPWAYCGWLGPLLFGLGLGLRRRWPLALGLIILFALAAVAAQAGRLIPALIAAALGLWSWDVGLWAVYIARAREAAPSREEPALTKLWLRLRRRQLIRATGVAVLAFALPLGFWYLRLSLPFWGVVGIVIVTFGLGAALLRLAARLYSQPPGGAAKGKRSSSKPTA